MTLLTINDRCTSEDDNKTEAPGLQWKGCRSGARRQARHWEAGVKRARWSGGGGVGAEFRELFRRQIMLELRCGGQTEGTERDSAETSFMSTVQFGIC